jgi:multidrug efflux pump subunit AcrB
MPPLIKPKGIDDVPIVSFTLWSENPNHGAYELAQVAHALEAQLKRVPGTRDIHTIGAPDRVVHVLLDPARLAGYGLALDDLRQTLLAANASSDAGSLVSDNRDIPLQAGSFLLASEQVGEPRSEAIVRLYNKIYSNQDWLPRNLGVMLPPLIKPKGIDDVPIVSFTLWSENPDHGAYQLAQVAHALEAQLKRVPGTRDIYTIGRYSTEKTKEGTERHYGEGRTNSGFHRQLAEQYKRRNNQEAATGAQ